MPTIPATAVAPQITKSMAQRARQPVNVSARSPARNSTPTYQEIPPEATISTTELHNSDELRTDLSEENIFNMRMAERKQLAAEMKELQSMTTPRSSSSNRKRAERVMGMPPKLDALM